MSPERPPAIAVVDYGMGNRRSVQKALEHVGARAQITSDHGVLAEADGIVLPGVGAFPQAMRNVTALGLEAPLRAAAERGTPLLGICLGMQLLFERSIEIEPSAGLGLLSGTVTPLDAAPLRIPHIGWSDVQFVRSSPLTAALPPAGCAFYHVHSLAVRPADPADVVGTTTYGETFATLVEHGSVFGAQFHPEKSSGHGLALLQSFTGICRAPAASARPVSLRA